jgi:hypothetical protein
MKIARTRYGGKMVAKGDRSRSSMTSATFGLPAHQIEPPTRGFSIRNVKYLVFINQ